MPNVRLVGPNGEMLGVVQTREAQRQADEQGMDLVEISPNAEPPVCKIMDFGKFRYEESIRQKQARKNATRVQLKEVKFHSGVEDNDLQTKLRHIREFIAEGNKVKITLQYRGRENAHKELGVLVVQRVIKEVDDVAMLEQQPRLLGRMLGCVLMPRPAKPTSGKSGQPSPHKHPASQPKPAAPAAPKPAAPAPVAPAASVAPAEPAPVSPVAPVAPVAPSAVSETSPEGTGVPAPAPTTPAVTSPQV